MEVIETVYKGYRFRSRLEARWAVFFDRLGIPWQYEPEGFKLSNGEWYLPDFLIPEGNDCKDMWVEVKPDTETDDSKVIQFTKDLLGPRTRKPPQACVLRVKGDPQNTSGLIAGNYCGFLDNHMQWDILKGVSLEDETWMRSQRDNSPAVFSFLWYFSYRAKMRYWDAKDAAQFARQHRFVAAID